MAVADDEIKKYPSWFRFDPFDHELINDFLKPKIMGKQLPCNIVKYRQVYGPSSNPWQVFDPNDDSSWLKSPHIKPNQKYMFVFANLSRLSNSDTSKNTSKKAGCGTWVCKSSPKKIRDGKGNVIGGSRYLVFEINDIDSAALGVGCDLDQVGFYTMHEYSLSGINQGCISEAQIEEEENNNNLEGSGSVKTDNSTVIDGGVCDNLDESRALTSISLSAIDSGVGDNLEERGNLSSESLVVRDSNVGDWYAAIDGGVCDNLDESRALTSISLSAIDSGVGDNLEERGNFSTESLVVRNSDVGDWYAAPQYNNGLQELDVFGGGLCFDDLGSDADFCFDDLEGGINKRLELEYWTDWLAACLDSNQEEEPVENNSFSKPGKRKFEANENSCRTKKMCL